MPTVESETPIHLLVLNHNGSALLRECLPSVIAAAEASRHDCRVIVVDNDSTDDSLVFLAAQHPQVGVIRCANQGLVSFNQVLAMLPGRVAVLLNNDIKLATDAIDPLVEPLLAPLRHAAASPTRRPFLTAPRCWRFDGQTYEGFRTGVGWRWGLVQATALFAGHAAATEQAGPTASAGAALAVDRGLFVELGGFDPLYLPGRIEDLDFAYRGYQAGYVAWYVPESRALHKGHASFGPAFGQCGSDRLALRNTLLFQWKHLRHPAHRLRQAAGWGLRLMGDLLRWPVQRGERRWMFARALCEARARWREHAAVAQRPAPREREFFREFAFHRLADIAGEDRRHAWLATERCRDANHPLSRWYLRPLALRLAALLENTAIRPWHLTLAGIVCAVLAVALMHPAGSLLAAGLLCGAWYCDRVDGPLARLQQSASASGAWLDANADELIDLGIHAAMAATAAAATGSQVPWTLLAAFIVGKYLLMYGLNVEHHPPSASERASEPVPQAAQRSVGQTRQGWCNWCYHLPANADVRMHLMIVALATGWFTAELALLAVYYNVRWLLRWVLVPWRLARTVPGGAAP